MKIPIYQIDAFTSKVFSGNPAAVCVLEAWIDDEILQSIAAENNLSETAFLVPNDGGFDIRWFTPLTEVALCGHATLAAAFVLFEFRQWPTDTVTFQTRESGLLAVTKNGGMFEMDFPKRPAHPRAAPPQLTEAIQITPDGVYDSAEDLLVVLPSEQAVRFVQPDFRAMLQIERRAVIVTARGDHSDFVSRFFAPRVGVPEDPVTGSAHCVLAPYWAGVLGKQNLHALQVSKRGGELFCSLSNDRVRISGKAVFFLEGMITIRDRAGNGQQTQ